MIYFCSNAQRNVLLPNCCSKAANLLFFWCQEKWGVLALFFIYLSAILGLGRAGGTKGGICRPFLAVSFSPGISAPSLGDVCPGKERLGTFLPLLLRWQPGSGLEGTSTQAREGPILEPFEFFMLLCFLMRSGFPHAHEDILALVCPSGCWLGCVPVLKVNLFPVNHVFDQVLRNPYFITAAMHLSWSRQFILQLDECKKIPHKDKVETN